MAVSTNSDYRPSHPRKYGFGGGLAVGSLIGGYLGYKIGRAVGTRKGGTFDTEKKIGRGIKSVFTKKKYAGGGGVRMIGGREYPFGSAWALEHNKHNKSEKYEVPSSSRKGRKPTMEKGGETMSMYNAMQRRRGKM